MVKVVDFIRELFFILLHFGLKVTHYEAQSRNGNFP